MPRGLGHHQRAIKAILQRTSDRGTGPLTFGQVRGIVIIEHRGRPEAGSRLSPAAERSLKRAMQTLVQRGDVLIVEGAGGRKDPYRYTTVEAFTGEADTATAKRVYSEVAEAALAWQTGRRWS
jgi:hypothetical protein